MNSIFDMKTASYLTARSCVRERLASLAKIGELARRQVRLLHAVFGYSQWFKCSISERWIVFDWQNFGMSSIKFDYRSQSNDWSSIGFDYGSERSIN